MSVIHFVRCSLPATFSTVFQLFSTFDLFALLYPVSVPILRQILGKKFLKKGFIIHKVTFQVVEEVWNITILSQLSEQFVHSHVFLLQFKDVFEHL